MAAQGERGGGVGLELDWAARIRLFTGLVLFIYATTHFLNHALGIWSVDLMEDGRTYFVAAWRSWPGTVLLLGSLFVHPLLALAKLYRRRTLRWAWWEYLQMGLGFSIPLLLATHVVGTRMGSVQFGIVDSYVYELVRLWPDRAIEQSVLMALVWIHGCIGLHHWLKLKGWYRATRGLWTGLAVAVPLAGWLGFASAAQVIAPMADDPAWLATFKVNANWPDAATTQALNAAEAAVLYLAGGLLALVIAARGVRWALDRRRGVVTIRYPGGLLVPVAPGTSILEASRNAGIAHASVCGGRGRCSTCRVRVAHGTEHLPPPHDDERRLLSRVGVGPGVRLACQTRPRGYVEVAPLLSPTRASPRDARRAGAWSQGEEREMAILFADLRGFTALAENRLPYDVVFILNQYFAAMGEGIIGAGGRVDKFIGDGVMALFGVNQPPDEACRAALRAAGGMLRSLRDLNESLQGELPAPLRMGIGIHAGPVIVGEMGYDYATTLTAIGDAVNVASRLEAASKTLDAEVVVSHLAAERAGVDLGAHALVEVSMRGRGAPLPVFAVADGAVLAEVEA